MFRSLEPAAAAPADSFVIGGESVYAALLDWCDTAYITKIGQAWEGADAFFPDLGAGPDWEMAEEGEPQEHAGIPFRYVTYRRRKPPCMWMKFGPIRPKMSRRRRISG